MNSEQFIIAKYKKKHTVKKNLFTQLKKVVQQVHKV